MKGDKFFFGSGDVIRTLFPTYAGQRRHTLQYRLNIPWQVIPQWGEKSIKVKISNTTDSDTIMVTRLK